MLKTDLNGRVAVIAGSGGKLDLALIRVFADNGATVALCVKPEDRPDAAALANYSDRAAIFDLDLNYLDTVSETVQNVLAQYGHIDILINNPMGAFANQARIPLHEMDLDAFTRETDAWLKGIMRFSKYCAKDMAERPEKGGVILNIFSVRGMTAVANESIAVAVSAGLHGLSKMWGVEMRDYHIRANGIAVGVLEDEPALPCGDAVRFSHGNIKRPCKAEEAANTAVFLASDAASYITGTVVTVDGGISAGYARSF